MVVFQFDYMEPMSHTLVKMWELGRDDFFLSTSQNGVGFPAMTNKVSAEHSLMHF